MKMPLNYPVWHRYVIQYCGSSAANNAIKSFAALTRTLRSVAAPRRLLRR